MLNRIAWLLFLAFVVQLSFAQTDSVYIISDITLVGNEKTKAEVIYREITFESGDTVTANKLRNEIIASKNNLVNTSLFNFVTINTNFLGKRASIVVLLEERWYLWPYPIFEYADRNVNIWLKEKEYDRLNYGLHLIKYNFRGRREILNMKIRLGFREQYQFYYENPYLDKRKKYGLYFGVARFRQKEIPYIIDSNQVKYFSGKNYIHHEWFSDIGFFIRRNFYFTHHFNAGLRESSVSDSIIMLNQDYHLQDTSLEKYFKIGYSIDYDDRDAKIYPLKGKRIYASISQYGLGYFTAFNASFLQLKLGLQINYQLANKWYAKSTAKYNHTFFNEPAYSAKSGLGYDDYLRGFEYFVIPGNQTMLWSNELKYNFLPEKIFEFQFIPAEKFNKTFLAGYVNFFFDLGYVNAISAGKNNYMANELLYSGGLGIDFVTYYDKILRINFAINSFNQKNLYLHFKIPF